MYRTKNRYANMSNLQVAQEIIDDYTHTEFPFLERDNWRKTLRIFKRLVREQEDKFTEELWENYKNNIFTIYRGGTPDGFSWSLSKDIAVWFALRFKAKGWNSDVYAMDIKRGDVLWYTDEREEQEVVLIPDPNEVIPVDYNVSVDGKEVLNHKQGKLTYTDQKKGVQSERI